MNSIMKLAVSWFALEAMHPRLSVVLLATVFQLIQAHVPCPLELKQTSKLMPSWQKRVLFARHARQIAAEVPGSD